MRIAALAAIRQQYPVLRYGRQYQRPISNFGAPFMPSNAGDLICWSRILNDEEVLCVVNGNGVALRGGDVVVDASLNSAEAAGHPWGATGHPFLQVVANSAQTAAGAAYAGTHPTGERLPVLLRNGTAYVQIRDVAPSEVLVLTNRP